MASSEHALSASASPASGSANDFPRYLSWSTASSTRVEHSVRHREIVDCLLPKPDDATNLADLSYLLIISEGVACTLLLANCPRFMPFTETTDRLGQESIAFFAGQSGGRRCSIALREALDTFGTQVNGSPCICALEVRRVDLPSSLSSSFSSSFAAVMESICMVVSLQQQFANIAPNFRIQRITDSWNLVDAWPGMSFEQSDKAIYTWVHEPNPKAFNSAFTALRKKADSWRKLEDDKEQEMVKNKESIAKARDECKRYENEMSSGGKVPVNELQEEHSKKVREVKMLEEKLNKTAKLLEDIKPNTESWKLALKHFEEKQVNSAKNTTIHCRLTVVLDDSNLIERLLAVNLRKAVNLLHKSLHDVGSWQMPESDKIALRLIEDEAKSFEQKASKYGTSRETVVDLLNSIGLVVEQNVTTNTSGNMSCALASIYQRLANMDALLQQSGVSLPETSKEDTRGKNLRKLLSCLHGRTHLLSLELEDLEKESQILKEACGEKKQVLLSKRLCDNGNVCYGVDRYPPRDFVSTQRYKDPNHQLNEVHIPFSY